MENQLLLALTSASMILMLGIVIALFILLNRGVRAATDALHGLRQDLAPLISDLRLLSSNAVQISSELRAFSQRIQGFSRSLGALGDDIDAGRRAIKGGLGKAIGFVEGIKAFFRPAPAPEPVGRGEAEDGSLAGQAFSDAGAPAYPLAYNE